jgi:hypothetical protein
VKAIGESFFTYSRLWLTNNQCLVLSGCFDESDIVWVISSTEVPQPEPKYLSNAHEADFRIWRHAISCSATNVLIYSPDTDVYNIGLTLEHNDSKQYIVQLNTPSAQIKKYVHVNNLITALQNDSDLVAISQPQIPMVMACLFV